MKSNKDVSYVFIDFTHIITLLANGTTLRILLSFKLKFTLVNDYKISNKENLTDNSSNVKHHSLFQGAHVFKIMRMLHRAFYNEVSEDHEASLQSVEYGEGDIQIRAQI